MSDGVSRPNWLGLSPELWGLIFLHLKPDQEDLLAVRAWSAPSIASFYTLSEVCTAFHQILQTDSRLHTSLCLWKQPSISSFVALSRYIRKHHSSIQILVTGYVSPWLETTLGLLIDAPVTKVCMPSVSLPALHLMTEFKSITHCTISAAAEIDLEDALGALPNLTNLTLEDEYFVGLESAVNLTSLRLQNCVVTCSKACSCVTSLLELQLESAKLHGFHQHGVCACSCLQYLRCVASMVDGNTYADILELNHDNSFPVDLSTLTALTKLEYKAGGGPAIQELDWLTVLQGLKSVSADLYAVEVDMGADLSTMVNLTNLKVLCSPVDEYGSVLSVDLDWTSLVALESLSLASSIIDNSCQNGLNGLLALKHLKHVKYSCKPSAEVTSDLMELSFKNGSRRPDMCIEFVDYS